MHANAATDVPARLEALGSTAGLDRAALHSQLAAALDVIVHLVRGRDGTRRIAQIHVLERDAAGLVTTVPAAVWIGPHDRRSAAAASGFVPERGWRRLEELCARRHADDGGGSVLPPNDGTTGDSTHGGTDRRSPAVVAGESARARSGAAAGPWQRWAAAPSQRSVR